MENMAEHVGEEVGIVTAAQRRRDSHLFWGGVVLSGLGSQVTTVAMAWQMYELRSATSDLPTTSRNPRGHRWHGKEDQHMAGTPWLCALSVLTGARGLP